MIDALVAAVVALVAVIVTFAAVKLRQLHVVKPEWYNHEAL